MVCESNIEALLRTGAELLSKREYSYSLYAISLVLLMRFFRLDRSPYYMEFSN